MEGKNCFRQRWTQDPLYSGGTIKSVVVKQVAPNTEAILVDGNTTNTTDTTTAVYVPRSSTYGEKKKSVYSKFEGLAMACGDEVNLVDAITGERLASYQTMNEDQVLNVTSVYVPIKNVNANGSAQTAPPGSYIAISTRSLQVMVFEVKQEVEIVTELVTPEKEQKPKAEKKSSEEDDNAAPEEEDEEEEELEKVEVTRASFTERFYLKQVQAWTASQHAVAMLLFSPCATFLLTGSTVGNIKAWNVFHHHLTHNMTMTGGGFITSMALSAPIANKSVVNAAGGAAALAAKNAKRQQNSKKSVADEAKEETTTTTTSVFGSSVANTNNTANNNVTGTVPQFLAVGTAEGHVTVFNFATTKAVFATTQPHVSPVDALVFVEGIMSSKGETKKGAVTLHQEWRVVSVGRDRKCVSNEFGVDICDVIAIKAAAETNAPELTYTTSSSGTLEEVRAVAFPEYSNCAVFESRHKLHVGTVDGVVSTYALDNNGRLSHLHRSPKPRGAGNLESLDDELTIRCVCVAASSKALRPDDEVAVADDAEAGDEALQQEDTGLSCIYAADATFCINHYTCKPGIKTITPSYTLIGFLDQILDIKLLDKPHIAIAAERAKKRRESREDDDDYHSYSSDSSSGYSSRSRSPRSDAEANEDDNAKKVDEKKSNRGKRERRVKLGPIANMRRLVITNTKVPRIFDGVGCVSTQYLEGHNDIVMCAAISADGKFIATGAKDKTVRLWDAASLKCLAIGKEAGHGVRGHSNEITGLVFSSKPTDSYHMLYSVGADENMCVWDPLDAITNTKPENMISEVSTANAGGAAIEIAVMQPRHHVVSIHESAVHGVAIAPNDQFLATCSKDKLVTVWNIVGKKVFKEAAMKGHKRAVTAVCFSPTDRVLASCANDASIRLWSLASFSCVKTLQHESQKPILQLSFFNKGLQIVTTDAEGTLAVWALSTSEVITNMELHKEKVWALNVIESKNGKETFFISGAANGTLCVTEDYTAEEALRIRHEHDDTVMKEQQLSNAMRLGEYENAFRLALRLNHPRHLRQVLSRWLAVDEEEVETIVSHSIFPSLSVDDTNRLLEFMREWLTNARYCHIASMLLHCLFNAFHFTEIERMRGLRAVLEAFVSYSNRHSQRMTQSLQRMYFIDYICRGQKAQHGGGLSLLAPYCPLVTGTLNAESKASVSAVSAAARQKESLVEQQKALERQHAALANTSNNISAYDDEEIVALELAVKVSKQMAPDSLAATVTAPAAKKKSRTEGSATAGSSNSHAAENGGEEGEQVEGAGGLMRGRVRPLPPPRQEENGYGYGYNRRGGGRGYGNNSGRGGTYGANTGGRGSGDRRASVSGYQGGRGGSSSGGSAGRGGGSSYNNGDNGGRGGGSTRGGFSRGGSSRGGSFRGSSRGGSRGGFNHQ